MKNGWTIGQKRAVSFNLVSNFSWGSALYIKASEDYHIDYSLQNPQNSFQNVTFRLLPLLNTAIYVRTTVILEEDKYKDVWLNIGQEHSSVRKYGQIEYMIPPTSFSNEAGFDIYTIDVPNSIIDTFYKNKGWKFFNISGIRLRGDMIISSILIY